MNPEAVLLWLLVAACAVYYLAALVAAGRWRATAAGRFAPPVSVLKPVRGRDREFYQCIHSHAAQDYPEFEVLFAARERADAAIPEIRRVAAEHPHRRIETFLVERELGPNQKVNSLERLRGEARHGIVVVSDSDVRVGPEWLRRVVAPLEDPGVGLATCLYRGVPAGGWPSRLEALWISTDFAVGVVMARLLRVPFALGAALAFRRADLERIGGFAPLAAYLADDYRLGIAIRGLGRRTVLSDYVVETVLAEDGWKESWRHRLRWARTLKACHPRGYAGLVVTFAVPLSLLALVFDSSWWPLAAVCVALRLAAGVAVAVQVVNDRSALRLAPLVPLADLLSFAVWVASFFGDEVEWRGEKFRLDRQGRLTSHSPLATRH